MRAVLRPPVARPGRMLNQQRKNVTRPSGGKSGGRSAKGARKIPPVRGLLNSRPVTPSPATDPPLGPAPLFGPLGLLKLGGLVLAQFLWGQINRNRGAAVPGPNMPEQTGRMAANASERIQFYIPGLDYEKWMPWPDNWDPCQKRGDEQWAGAGTGTQAGLKEFKVTLSNPSTCGNRTLTIKFLTWQSPYEIPLYSATIGGAGAWRNLKWGGPATFQNLDGEGITPPDEGGQPGEGFSPNLKPLLPGGLLPLRPLVPVPGSADPEGQIPGPDPAAGGSLAPAFALAPRRGTAGVGQQDQGTVPGGRPGVFPPEAPPYAPPAPRPIPLPPAVPQRPPSPAPWPPAPAPSPADPPPRPGTVPIPGLPVPAPVPLPNTPPAPSPVPDQPQPQPLPEPEPATVPLPFPQPFPLPQPGPGTRPSPGPDQVPGADRGVVPSPTGEPMPFPYPRPLPTPQTDPETHFTPLGPVGGPGQAPPETLRGIANEVGRIEGKLNAGMVGGFGPPPEGPPPPDPPTPYGPAEYALFPVCERGQDGQPLPPKVVEIPATVGDAAAIMARIDALAELLQAHKELRQPICKQKPVGEPVQITFQEIPEE